MNPDNKATENNRVAVLRQDDLNAKWAELNFPNFSVTLIDKLVCIPKK